MTRPDPSAAPPDNEPAPNSILDGPTLRAVRESIPVPLRRIARQAGMSHGHLSKVERGEHGRPVTPAILAAYERVTGMRLHEVAVDVVRRNDALTGRRGRTWRPGELTELRRRGYNAAIGAIAVGGLLGEPVGRLLDSTGRPIAPSRPEVADVAQLEALREVLTGLDLRYGGGLAGQAAKAMLRWSAPMLDTSAVSGQQVRGIHATFGALAHRAAWSAYDVAAHEAARSLFRLALSAAVRTADADLRAHVLADMAAQHNQLGYHHDALEVIRIAEGDERVSAAVRMVVHGVKARTYAAIDQPDQCRRQLDLAELAYAAADPDAPGWVGRLCDPAHLPALAGQALAELATATDRGTDRDADRDADRKEARDRLTQAVDRLDPARGARRRSLCLTRLAQVELAAGDFDRAADWTRQALPGAGEIASARLDHALTGIRAAAAAHPAVPVMCDLLAELDAVRPPDDAS